MDYRKDEFVVLEFSSVERVNRANMNIKIDLDGEQVIEVAAVKIKDGEIQGNYHSFIAIDGHSGRDIEFDSFNLERNGVRAEHLIGAPAFSQVAKDLCDYIGGAIIVLRIPAFYMDKERAFRRFTKKAKEQLGIEFGNEIIFLSDVLEATIIKQNVMDSCDDPKQLSILEIAAAIKPELRGFTDWFSEYEVFYDPDDKSCHEREDILTLALMHARLFVAVNNRFEQIAAEGSELPF